MCGKIKLAQMVLLLAILSTASSQQGQCGNGALEGAEECDDGNTRNCDGCDASCLNETVECRCGNELLEPDNGEQCDDGDTLSCNGCSSTCQIETAACTCGDNVTQPDNSEQCDDGNTVDGDGCSSNCSRELDFVCRTQFQPSVCTKCGNRKLDQGEECDDGGFSNGDGCTVACKIEVGYTCNSSEPSVCIRKGLAVCGNGDAFELNFFPIKDIERKEKVEVEQERNRIESNGKTK